MVFRERSRSSSNTRTSARVSPRHGVARRPSTATSRSLSREPAGGGLERCNSQDHLKSSGGHGPSEKPDTKPAQNKSLRGMFRRNSNHKTPAKNMSRFHTIPSVRRGRSATPKTRSKSNMSEKKSGLSNKLRSFSRNKKQEVSEIDNDSKDHVQRLRGPSLQPSPPKKRLGIQIRKRGKSMPALHTSKQVEEEGLQQRRNRGENSSGFTRSISASRSQSHSRRNSRSPSSHGERRTHFRRRDGDKPVERRRRPSRNGMVGSGRSSGKKSTRQDELNEHCRKHFMADRLQSRQRSQSNRRSFSREEVDKVPHPTKTRSRSLPPTIIGNGLNIDKGSFERSQRDISPIPSVLSSYKHERRRLKKESASRRKSADKVRERSNRERSHNLKEFEGDFSADREINERMRRRDHIRRTKQKISEARQRRDSANRDGALVPYGQAVDAEVTSTNQLVPIETDDNSSSTAGYNDREYGQTWSEENDDASYNRTARHEPVSSPVSTPRSSVANSGMDPPSDYSRMASGPPPPAALLATRSSRSSVDKNPLGRSIDMSEKKSYRDRSSEFESSIQQEDGIDDLGLNGRGGKKSTETESIGSLTLNEDAPSSTGTADRKFISPPLHSDIRSRKPQLSTVRSTVVKLAFKQKWFRNIWLTCLLSYIKSFRGGAQKDRGLRKDSKQEKTPTDPQPSLAHSRSRLKERIQEIQVSEDKDEISEITTPAVLLRAPPPHSRIRALKPQNRNNNEGSTMPLGEDDDGKESRAGILSEVDVRSKVTPVSALTTPNIPPPIATALRSMNSAPVSSQHLQSKKQSPPSENLHQSLPVLDEERVSQTQGTLPQAGNPKQSASSSAYNKFAPPPPRRHRPAPPPRHEHNKDSFQQQKQHFRRQHQPTMATVHNSIEDLAASFFSSSELNRPRKNVTTNPGMSVCPPQPQQQSDNDSVRSERLKPPAPPPKRAHMSHLTRNDLGIAAAQLINMQSQNRGQPNRDFGAGEAPLPFKSQQHIGMHLVGMQLVDNMPYTDYHSGSCGLYSGSCDNFGRPQ